MLAYSSQPDYATSLYFDHGLYSTIDGDTWPVNSTSNLFSALFLIFFNLFPTLFPCYFFKKISINLSFSKFPLFPLQFCKFSFKFHILDFNFLFSCFSCYISLNTLSLIFMLNRNLKCLLWYVAFL